MSRNKEPVLEAKISIENDLQSKKNSNDSSENTDGLLIKLTLDDSEDENNEEIDIETDPDDQTPINRPCHSPKNYSRFRQVAQEINESLDTDSHSERTIKSENTTNNNSSQRTVEIKDINISNEGRRLSENLQNQGFLVDNQLKIKPIKIVGSEISDKANDKLQQLSPNLIRRDSSKVSELDSKIVETNPPAYVLSENESESSNTDTGETLPDPIEVNNKNAID